jgi:hypothetical protein
VDEAAAKAIAADFKKRIYEMGAGHSPATLLIQIAEKEHGLQPIHVPEQFRRAIEQNLTDTSVQEIGEVTHASGVILRSRQ